MNFIDAASYYVNRAIKRIQINVLCYMNGLPNQSGYEVHQKEPTLLLECIKKYEYYNSNTSRTFNIGDKITVKRWERADEFSLDRSYFKKIKKHK